jgi:uncharacterized protein
MEDGRMKPDICIYHGNCADGFTAAWAVWKRFGDEVQYVPGVYGESPPDVTGKNVVIVDFSYKRPVLAEMLKAANSILVLDHHKTAEADLGDGYEGTCRFFSVAHFTGTMDWKRYQDNLYQDDCENAGKAVYTLFDMNRSGAGIVWDFFHPKGERPPLVNYVEDRDLWKFKLNKSREVNAFIFAHEYTFANWDKLFQMLNIDMPQAIAGGSAIELKHHKDVAELVAKLRRGMVIGGHLVPVANMPYTLTSDAGHLMCQPFVDGMEGPWTAPFAACYWDTPEGRVFSLRSDDQHGGADVSEIAKGYGGGGHKNAAGFTMPIGWEGDA